jgi:hypothetical protein
MTNEENFAEYVRKNGEEILLNDTLVKGLICDFFSSDTAFKNVLSVAVQAGVVKKLCALKKNGAADIEFEIAKITRGFIQENAIMESAAKNAVNCFAAVLFDKKPRRENAGQKPGEAEATAKKTKRTTDTIERELATKRKARTNAEQKQREPERPLRNIEAIVEKLKKSDKSLETVTSTNTVKWWHWSNWDEKLSKWARENGTWGEVCYFSYECIMIGIMLGFFMGIGVAIYGILSMLFR